MKDKAYLFGPFFGELSWEYFRFAPYAIYLKKISPDIKMIVLTREDRFDLYGQYADILIPMRIDNESKYDQSAFKLLNYGDVYYETIAQKFKLLYKERYNIVDHFYPDISGWRYKVKWQFPRDRMDYSFIPRKKNKEVVEEYLGDLSNIFLSSRNYGTESDKYKMLYVKDVMEDLKDKIDEKTVTSLGCLIYLIKKSTVVVSTLQQDLGHLAILLRNDSVILMNPLKTKIIDCKTVQEGIRLYENNI